MKVPYLSPTTRALAEIMDERHRQVHHLGHTPEHDAEAHARGCLALAAAARLAMVASLASADTSERFARDLRNMAIVLDPWSSAPALLKVPARRLLVEAGALAAAELERIDGLPPGGAAP